ncbi:peptidoglycan-binding domain-containing protein [Shimia biformata]|uniref:peptidoglycan-binding domain-containing protein n=1 Tax=Shimia biformata TaxID=1294299 RepID=UPI001951ADDE|nr:peptidoglycan-binding protein [Shimia biformata]
MSEAAHDQQRWSRSVPVPEGQAWQAQSNYSRSRDRAAWNEATYEDSLLSYIKYRKQFPNGLFVKEAKARIRAFERLRDNRDRYQQMLIEDRVLSKNKPAALDVERRLSRLGFDPGPIDGKFDQDTQRAVRQFQRSRGLPVTGFVTKETRRVLTRL